MRTTLFVDELTVLDYAYLSPALGVRGESLSVGAELDGVPDAHGFIVDFGRLKKLIKRVVDEEVDHRLCVPADARGLEAGAHGLDYRFGAEVLRYSCPAQAMVSIPGAEVTPPVLAAALEARIRPRLPANVSGLRISLRAEARAASEPSFCYTHGLKHHDGNCQRMLHGHRNVIEALWDGRRDAELERTLVLHLADKHFANAADVRDGVVAYAAAQGEFRVELPRERLLLLSHEPSIENIAAYAHAWLCERRELDGGRLVLSAYEGLRKGATIRT